MNKHRLHCTCPQCGKTGMTVTEQATFCNGKGQRLIGAPDNPKIRQDIAFISVRKTFERLLREELFGHYPN